MDFIKALFNHNSFHINSGNLDRKFLLTRNKFSFKNIHMNIGNVHYNSTSSKKSVAIKSLAKQSKQLLTKSIFEDLKTFLDNNPVYF